MTPPVSPAAPLTAAAGTGVRLNLLRALRDRLAADLDACQSSRDVASLSQRLMDVAAQIDELGGGVVPKKPENKLDEFTKRLRDREQPAAKPSRRARS